MLEKLIPEKFHYDLYRFKQSMLRRNYNKSYSQEGEDMILKRIFEMRQQGFFVDIGAHHPTRFSNTYYFYKKGWRGINIDAMPGSMKAFNAKRPHDNNLEIAISKDSQVLTYYSFVEPAINGFDRVISEERIKNGDKLKKKIQIKTSTLEDVLDKHLKGRTIDFITIDVEGLDFQILESNNWEKYQPAIILIECLNQNIEDIQNDKVYQFLYAKNYRLIAKTVNTCFFELKKVESHQ